MRKECAWCGEVLNPGTPGAEVTHGMCRSCATRAATDQVDEPSTRSGPPEAILQLLFLDDSAAVLAIIDRILTEKRPQWRWRLFAKSKRALDQLARNRYSVVISNQSDFLRRAQTTQPSAARVLLTGLPPDDATRHCCWWIDEVYLKPFSPNGLIAALEDLATGVQPSTPAGGSRLGGFVQ